MADLTVAIYITLQNEGGFQANPKDRANWTSGKVGVGQLVGTKYGITALDMPGVDIALITQQQATEYYLEHYVKPLYAQINAQPVANKLFDLGVLFGVGEAIKCLQQALRLADVDGDFGPETLQAVNSADSAQLVAAYKARMAKRAIGIAQENPNDAPDLPDWLRRVNS
jgi:lysozyme family protein